MAKKPLGVDKMGIQKTMRIGDYLADCGGQFALNAMTGLVSAVLYFYTEKVGVAAATAANVLLAAKIVDAFAARQEAPHFAHLASRDDIAAQEYNLSVSTYVEAEDTREKIDIHVLNAEIAQIVAREQALREEIDKIIGEIEG